MKAFLKTYGCTLNQADSDTMASVLKGSSVEVTQSESEADVIIVNTCTVKNATSQKILYKLNNLDRSGRKVVVTGCMAGANQDMIAKYAPGASIVTAPNIGMMADVVHDTASGIRRIEDRYKKTDRLALFEPGSSVIAKVAVSDGCASSCSFCETKFARGALNSFSEKLIIRAIESSVQAGAREIQLTSQDMGAYGIDRGTNIAELMEMISDIEGSFKVRIGMMNPDHMHRYFDAFAAALSSPKFYRFAHIPIQSGSARVIGEMRRQCTPGRFCEFSEELRKRVPGITIETDIIVGFPTETEKDFSETAEFLERARPDVTNISRFGARPHASASMLEQNSPEVINSRSNRLSRIVREIQHGINDRFIGKRLDVMITELNGRSCNGRTESYKQVVFQDAPMQVGSVSNATIKAASANVLYA